MKTLNLFLEGIQIAFGSLLSNRLRTILTILGVAIGIWAITIIATLVYSLQFSISANLSKLGNTVMYVHNWPWKDNSEDWFKYWGRPKVSFADYERVKEGLPVGNEVAYEVSLNNQTVKHEGRSVTGVEVKAVTNQYALINGLEISSGRFVSAIENDAGRPVCVLGLNIARAIMGNGPYDRQYIRLNGKKLLVVGVLKEVGAGFFGTSMDDRILVPYKFASRTYNLRPRRYDKVVTVKAASHENLDQIESEVIGLVRAARGLKPSAENNFSINKQEVLMNQLDDFFGYLRTGGWVISIFAIIVGGFGIGNIMYTSVKERTFEIGLQKAIGATRNFILFQFLFESVLMCFLGGIVGLMILYASALGAEYAIAQMDVSMQMVVTTQTIVQGMVISVVIGLISGLIPSIYASGLDPVESMRAKM